MHYNTNSTEAGWNSPSAVEIYSGAIYFKDLLAGLKDLPNQEHAIQLATKLREQLVEQNNGSNGLLLGLSEYIALTRPKHFDFAAFEPLSSLTISTVEEFCNQPFFAFAPLPKIQSSCLSQCTFSFKITGDSMSPNFRDSDIILVDPLITPTDNDFVISRVKIKGREQIVFRKYIQYDTGRYGKPAFVLVALNAHYPTLSSEVASVTILGTMVEHRKFRENDCDQIPDSIAGTVETAITSTDKNDALSRARANINYLMTKNGISCTKLARLSGISQPNVYRFTKGQQGTGAEYLRALAKSLNVSLEDLFEKELGDGCN